MSLVDPIDGGGDGMVVGAPRSGTSLVSQLLHGAGSNVGPDLIPAADANPLGFVGRASASDVWEPSLQQMHATVANASQFRSKWGWWPMGGSLRQMVELGLIAWSSDARTIRIVARF